jgi:hypothetical protein
MSSLEKNAVLRIGEVCEVVGRKVSIMVDTNKNLSDLFFDGDILKNISVGNYVEIKKGYSSIIGKVDGERIEADFNKQDGNEYEDTNKNRRILNVSLVGHFEFNGSFTGGMKELPLMGNEAFILTKEKVHLIHNLVVKDGLSIKVATTESDDIDVELPVNGLFNSHIAIFGNTGSGKSNTLARLYQELFSVLNARNEADFKQKTRFLFFDFNGEFVGPHCISDKKQVLNLSTRSQNGDRIPIHKNSLLDIEILAILADATEKTQKPFLRRTLSLYNHVNSSDITDPIEYFRNILRKEIKRSLQMSDKVKAHQVLDYLREILPPLEEDGMQIDIVEDLDWHNTNEGGFKIRNETNVFLQQRPERIEGIKVYLHVENLTFDDNLLLTIIKYLYLQLIMDIVSNRAQNEHVAPAINKLKSKMHDIERIFETTSNRQFWNENVIVINMDDINLEMKKTVPLLLSKKLYTEHKRDGRKKSLNIIIDEAHNILSKESFREAESWKDYRLETFEEIIKEGRKFGVFITIASQRPNDISATITSQAHNYFIHRLINQKDLETISSAVSYIDRVTEESIPTLPTGMCIFSGVASQMPLKIRIEELADDYKPRSHTVKFEDLVSETADDKKNISKVKSESH